MLKLYRFSESAKEYWETWEDEGGSHTVHWGELGTRGESKTVQSSATQTPRELIQTEINALISQGFAPIEPEDHVVLMIQYAVKGMGSQLDLEKRHRLEDRMNETLGWTGLGACDGGSLGSGTMEVCAFVVDFELAKKVIEADLVALEFSDYKHIYKES